jgi:hypothetical protein
MRTSTRVSIALAALGLLVPASAAAAPGGIKALAPVGANVKVTSDSSAGTYERYDGTTDAITEACSTGRRGQYEPTVAVSPRNPDIVVAGAIDECVSAAGGLVWPGIYRSTDGGQTWDHSLVPGYLGDESAAGQASPIAGCPFSADPSMAFNRHGRLHYTFLCITGDLYAATYDPQGNYVRTVLVSGASETFSEDKPNLTVDQTAGPYSGNVYISWTRFFNETDSAIFVARSTDGGTTFGAPVKVADGQNQAWTDVTVGPTGRVYVSFRKNEEIFVAQSRDGGVTFELPRQAAVVDPFDSGELTGNGVEACGDGPFDACAEPFTLPDFDTLTAVSADESGVHVTWHARIAGGQSKIFVRNANQNLNWFGPARTLDATPTGHQIWPDITSTRGKLVAVFYDSRRDPGYGPDIPPGNTATGTNSGGGYDTFVAVSRDGGVTWRERRLTDVMTNPNYESFTLGGERIPFFGDYIYVSAADGNVNAVWADSRDVVPGQDTRVGADTDGFDVFAPCAWDPNDINAPAYTTPTFDDACLSQGGLDYNIYSSRLEP